MAALALTLTGCSGSGQDATASDESTSAAWSGETARASWQIDSDELGYAPLWVSQLPSAQDAWQLFVVAGVGKTAASIGMYERDDEGTWRTLLTTQGYIGKNGLGKTEEGDEKTPVGSFAFNKAFGIASDPGCSIAYTQVTDDDYWSGDARLGMHYNELVSIKEVPGLDTQACEHIIDYKDRCQYCLNISYNKAGRPGKGGAIFLQCFSPNETCTDGGISIPQDKLVQVMKFVDKGCVVVIDSLEAMGATPDQPTEDDMVMVGTADAAAQRAGIAPMDATDDPAPGLGAVREMSYLARIGAEAVAYRIGAASVTVYKGIADDGGDITGDAARYKKRWTWTIGGMAVTCYGSVRGAAQKALWHEGAYDYALIAKSEGGAGDLGLRKATLRSFIDAVQ